MNVTDDETDEQRYDIDALRAMLVDLLGDDADADGAHRDERLESLVAHIVEAYGRYQSSRGPSYSSYQALKAMALDQLEGRLLAGLLAPYGEEPTPTQEQLAKAIAKQRISQLRQLVEAETKRRTAEQLGRDHVTMYGIPQLSENVEFLRASADQLRQMRRVVAPLARMLATRLAARRRRSRAGEIDLRKTLRKSMNTGGVPIDVVLRKPRPARPELVVLCDVSGPWPASATSRCCSCTRCVSNSRGFASSPSSTPPTRSPTCSARKPTSPWRCSGSPASRRCTPATATATTATRSCPSTRSTRRCSRRVAHC